MNGTDNLSWTGFSFNEQQLTTSISFALNFISLLFTHSMYVASYNQKKLYVQLQHTS
jgi:hypothetical protein